MSDAEVIERLCGLLRKAAEIIQEQAAILAMHGITTADGRLEMEREAILGAVPPEE